MSGESGAGQGGGGDTGVSGGGSGGDGPGGRGGRGGRDGRGGRGGASPGGAAGDAGSAGDAGAGGSGDTSPNLFFSEYAETSGTDPDAVEIINKSGGSVSLSACSVLVYLNAAAAPTSTINLTGTLADGEVFVLCTDDIGGRCDATAAALALDGNDAVALRCDGVILDVIGRTTGASPGNQWGNMTVGTRNQTLRRNCSVTTGDRSGTNPFNPATQWTSFAVDTVTGLGSAACAG